MSRALFLAFHCGLAATSCALLDAVTGDEAGLGCDTNEDCREGEDCVAPLDAASAEMTCHVPCLLNLIGEGTVSDDCGSGTDCVQTNGFAHHCFVDCESDESVCGNADCVTVDVDPVSAPDAVASVCVN